MIIIMTKWENNFPQIDKKKIFKGFLALPLPNLWDFWLSHDRIHWISYGISGAPTTESNFPAKGSPNVWAPICEAKIKPFS